MIKTFEWRFTCCCWQLTVVNGQALVTDPVSFQRRLVATEGEIWLIETKQQTSGVKHATRGERK